MDTVQAVRDENHVDTYGLSGDYRLGGPFTAIVSVFGQSFEDGNERLGRVFRLDYASGTWSGFASGKHASCLPSNRSRSEAIVGAVDLVEVPHSASRSAATSSS